MQNSESYIDIFLSRALPFNYQILNLQGQLIAQETPLVQLGLNSFSLKNMQRFPKGTYLIKLQFGQKGITKTWVVP